LPLSRPILISTDHRVKTEEASTAQSLSVGFVSLGCAKNLADSQIMGNVLPAESITLAPSPEEADITIVNTCAFIEEAREEAFETILSVCDLKKTGRCRAVLVAGCLPRRYGKGLMEFLCHVDAFIGLDELEEVGDVVCRLARGKKDTHFKHLLAFVEQSEFDHLGVFVDSPEEDTRAVDLVDWPDAEVAEERRDRLPTAQRRIVGRKARRRIGSEAEVLLERTCEDLDRSRAQAPEADGVTLVEKVSADKGAGDFVIVRYTAQLDYDMKAVQV
jgi:tRNA A37 methylthiotransferase MiaB